MNTASEDVWLAGVDGCPHGWIAAFVRPAEPGLALRRRLLIAAAARCFWVAHGDLGVIAP